ncbi:hypothetical protein WA1_08075 [Scytonema hofmannii PCC 7110]|uniref:Uncharacterized protein n=1 Tax=Scytonema hofmannii PCC 7110 TaxID=128403 RepID=A0A139WTK3_9CYAN|nr:hypothetical protein [Scytonema hofmannii]KYC35750.1 hypothetical protein WA1_08075 [Scytonema hofmannii PCC 7110]
MDKQERQIITNELKALEKQLQAKKADEKTVALEKAQFFADWQLERKHWVRIIQMLQLRISIQSFGRALLLLEIGLLLTTNRILAKTYN